MRIKKINSLVWVLCPALLLAADVHAQYLLLSNAPEPSVTSMVPASAAIVPVLPRATRRTIPGMAVTDWALLGAAAGLRYLDYQTTVKALSDPADFHEVELPKALVDNHAAFAAFEVSTVVVNYWVYRALVRHGHRRLARAGQAINLGAIGGTVAFNEYNLAEYYPSHR
jgi:hypothetical protein